MLFQFEGVRISALSAAVPLNELRYDDDALNYNFPLKKSMKLKELMGYDRHRVALPCQCSSDFAAAALGEAMDRSGTRREDIGALVCVTQSPDYFIPPTSSIVQTSLGLPEDILCVDMNQGCAGFVCGLFQAFSMLRGAGVGKVAVVCADVLSKKVNPRDRNSHPLIGDAGAAAIVENSPDSGRAFCFSRVFGKSAFDITIPAGGFKTPSSPETALEAEDCDGNLRSLDNLVMNGASVFGFVQEKVPEMADELLAYSGLSKDDIDAYAFHQPNRFMLEKLADRMGVPHGKMPNNIVGLYGNSSSATIPVNICKNYAESLSSGEMTVMLGGFGAGLTLAGIIMKLGPLNSCSLIEI